MIVHPPEAMRGNEPFAFAELGGFTCSICAPATMQKADVEAVALTLVGYSPMGGWEAIDKSKIGMGTPTPNPCNVAPGRRHWFLVGGVQAAALGYPTRK